MDLAVFWVAVSVGPVAVLCGSPWNGDRCFISVHELFQFPMDWGWEAGPDAEKLF